MANLKDIDKLGALIGRLEAMSNSKKWDRPIEDDFRSAISRLIHAQREMDGSNQ